MGAPVDIEKLPPEVQALGEPIAVFYGNRFIAYFLMGFAALTIGGIGLMAIFLLFQREPFVYILIMVVVFWSGAAVLFVMGWLIWRICFVVSPGGIARIRGSKVDIAPWENLKLFVRFHPRPFLDLMGCTNIVNIESAHAGEWQVFYDVGNVDQLAKTISQEIIRRELEPTVAQINQGELVRFGGISVSSVSIRNERRELTWDAVRLVESKLGRDYNGIQHLVMITSVSSLKPWAEINVSEIANLELLFAVLKEIQPGVIPRPK